MAARKNAYEAAIAPKLEIGEGIAPTLRATDRARHLPAYVYTSQEVYEMEKDKIFMKEWLVAGREEEIEKPGDYLTFRVMDEPVLVVRDRLGQINALSNVCRHRGVEVARGHGNAKQFTCPYHNWTYDLEGKLLNAPYMDTVKNFDFADCRMGPLRCDTWQGWIYVNFDPKAAPLSEAMKETERDFGMLQQQRCRMADKYEAEFDCNWKLLVENDIDPQHVQIVHYNTFGANMPPQIYLPFNIRKKGYSSSVFEAPITTEGSHTLFGVMPWLDVDERFSCLNFAFPNNHLMARADTVWSFNIWPLSVDRCRFTIYALFPAEFFKRKDFKRKVAAAHHFVELFVEEDQEIMRSQQRTIRSSRFQPGPFANVDENVHNFLRYYAETMFGRKKAHRKRVTAKPKKAAGRRRPQRLAAE